MAQMFPGLCTMMQCTVLTIYWLYWYTGRGGGGVDSGTNE